MLSGTAPGSPYSEEILTVPVSPPNSMAKLNRPPSCQTATLSGPSADSGDPMPAGPSVPLYGVENQMSPCESW